MRYQDKYLERLLAFFSYPSKYDQLVHLDRVIEDLTKVGLRSLPEDLSDLG